MGTVKNCPYTKIQEVDNCLGLVNQCDSDPNEPVDFCVTSPWSIWSPCSVSCGNCAKYKAIGIASVSLFTVLRLLLEYLMEVSCVRVDD